MLYSFSTNQKVAFACCALLFLSHQLLELQDVHFPFLDNYLDVFLFPLLALPLLLLEKRFLLNRPAYIMDFPIVLAYAIGFSILSEFVFPLFSNRFTTDLIDVVCIILGAVVFYFVYRNKKNRLNNKRLKNVQAKRMF